MKEHIFNHAIDYFVLVSFLYFMTRGYKQGFLKTIIGPISLIICGILGYYYYHVREELLRSLFIISFGPFLFAIGIHILLRVWDTVSLDKDEKISALSRFLGSCFCLLWRGPLLLITLLLLTLLPSGEFGWLANFQDKIFNSYSYQIMKGITQDQLPTADGITKVLGAMRDPEKVGKMRASQEYQNIMKEPEFAEFIEDEKVKRLIDEKNLTALISHPKMRALLNNKTVMQNVIKINKQLLTEK